MVGWLTWRLELSFRLQPRTRYYCAGVSPLLRITHPFTLRPIRALAFGTPHTRGRKW